MPNNGWDHLMLKLYIVVDRTRVGGKKAEQTSCQRSMLAAIRKYPLFLIYRSSSPNARFCVFSWIENCYFKSKLRPFRCFYWSFITMITMMDGTERKKKPDSDFFTHRKISSRVSIGPIIIFIFPFPTKDTGYFLKHFLFILFSVKVYGDIFCCNRSWWEAPGCNFIQ